MLRTYLQFFVILSAIAVIGGAVYWFTREKETPQAIEIPWNPKYEETKSPSAPSETMKTPAKVTNTLPSPSQSMPVTTPSLDDEEDAPKPASASRQKFESEDETDDTDDSVSIEVEPEEE